MKFTAPVLVTTWQCFSLHPRNRSDANPLIYVLLLDTSKHRFLGMSTERVRDSLIKIRDIKLYVYIHNRENVFVLLEFYLTEMEI